MKLVNLGNIAESTPLGPGVRKVALATALALALSLPVFAQQGQRDDAAIEADIVNVLSSSPALKNQQITAATIGGDVTLSGTVPDQASKELAEMAVSRVSGVKSVENHLTIGAANTSAQPESQPPQNPQSEDQGAPPQPMEQGTAQAPGAPATGSRPPYVPDSAVYSAPSAPRNPVVIPQGTLLKLRTSEPLDSKHTEPGAMVEFTSASDIYSGGALAIPRGAVLEGQVVEVQNPNSGSITGKKSLSLKLNSLVLEGRTYVIDSDIWTAQGSGKGGYTAGNTAAGAAIGAVIGAIAGGGPGAAIGAVAGGATGVAASAATSGPQVVLPPETLVSFHLQNPVTVIPVSQQEAQRLATAQGGNRPYLHGREAYGYPGPPVAVYPYPYPYYYAYPYPYYYHRYYYHRY